MPTVNLPRCWAVDSSCATEPGRVRADLRLESDKAPLLELYDERGEVRGGLFAERGRGRQFGLLRRDRAASRRSGKRPRRRNAVEFF